MGQELGVRRLSNIAIIGESVKTASVLRLMQEIPGANVYKENIAPANMVFPNFYVSQETINAEEDRPGKWFLYYLMSIRYLDAPDPALVSNLNLKLDSVALDLMAAFPSIKIGSHTVPVVNPRTEKANDILFFFYNVRFQVEHAELEEIKQWTLDVEEDFKIGGN